MWITPASSSASSASSASPSIDDDLAPANPTAAAAPDERTTPQQAERTALSRLRALPDVSDSIQRSVHHLRGSHNHFSPATIQDASMLLCDLAEYGRVVVPAGDKPGMEAAEAALWALESCMPGTELIIGPDRPSALRAVGEPTAEPQDEARAFALLRRIRSGSWLHLVFCHDGKGTPAQEQAYREKLHQNAQPSSAHLGGRRPYLPGVQSIKGTYFEPKDHLLSMSRSEFPQDLSGVLILPEAGPKQEVFALHSEQANPMTSSRSLVLRWASGPWPSQTWTCLQTGRGSPQQVVASDVADPSLKRVLDQWASFLASNGAQEVRDMLVRD